MSVAALKKLKFPDWILLTMLLLAGGFHEYISCILSAVMCFYLLIRFWKTKKCTLSWDLLPVSVAVICIGYGVTCLWAVDKGMAFVGFLKFLPLMLYVFCLWQEGSDKALQCLPCFAALMAVISAVGMQFDFCRSLFAVSGRLGGFFQYPNTFALFLLVCELLLLKKAGKKLLDYIVLVILIGGLLYTGSRAVFVLAILSNIVMLFAVTGKKARIGIMVAMVAVCGVVIVLALNENSVLHRYLTISFTESTFVGRILYLADALKLLLKYPFGMGYMGYYYTQYSIQTGVYSVMYIHNDFMQLLLDIGWIPGLLFMGALIGWFFKKTICPADKIIVATVCLHCLFDFNLQFVGVFMLLMLLMGAQNPEKKKTLSFPVAVKAVFAVLGCICIYMGVALALSHWGNHQLSDQIYPYNTNNKLTALEQTQDLNEAVQLADEILQQNQEHYVPYSIKAKYSYSKGDFGSVIRYMNTAIEKNPFEYTLYEEYCKMLMVGVSLYQQAGDTQSMQACMDQLRQTGQKLQANAGRLSTLGKMIDDQPVTTLPADIQAFIDQLR